MPLNSDKDLINQLRQLVQKAEYSGDADLMASVLAEDITVIIPGSPVIRGKNNAVNFIKTCFEGYDIKLRIQQRPPALKKTWLMNGQNISRKP